MKESVFTEKAPRPTGPYSQAIKAGGFIFVSGQIPLDPATGKLVEGGFEEKARRVMENVKAILEAAGASMDDVVYVRVYLSDLGMLPEFNRVYAEYFKGLPPARVVVEAPRLPLGAEVAVEAVAYVGADG
ncbi:Rid family detoxifying hydrolase [Stetteria hydrogenophila]